VERELFSLDSGKKAPCRVVELIMLASPIQKFSVFHLGEDSKCKVCYGFPRLF